GGAQPTRRGQSSSAPTWRRQHPASVRSSGEDHAGSSAAEADIERRRHRAVTCALGPWAAEGDCFWRPSLLYSDWMVWRQRSVRWIAMALIAMAPRRAIAAP